MSGPPFLLYFIVAVLLFGMGVTGFFLRKHLIMLLMCLELMFQASGLLFVMFARFQGNLRGHVFTALLLVIFAAEMAIGLALLVLGYQKGFELRVESFAELRDESYSEKHIKEEA